MAIEMSCPHCGKEYVLSEAQAGKKVACKSCKEGFVVRMAARDDNRPRRREREEDDRPRRRDEEEDRPRSRRDDPDDRPRRRRDQDEEDDRPRSRRRDEDDYDDRPRRRPRPGGGGKVWLIVGLSVGGVVVLGLLIALVAAFAGGGGGVTKANRDKIRPGMTEGEVNAILGKGIDMAAYMDKKMRAVGAGGNQMPFGGGMFGMGGFGMKVMVHEGWGNDFIAVVYQNGRVVSVGSSFDGDGMWR